MLPGMIVRRTSLLAVALVVALGALTGCRQAPLDPGYPVPSPGATGQAGPLRVDFTVPAGFVEAYNYTLFSPLYPAPETTFLIPTNALEDNGETIAVASYLMDVDVTGESNDQLLKRVKGYATQVRSAVTEPVKSTVSGLPAFTMPIKEPKSSGAGFYTYNATYVFSGNHLIETICQNNKQQALIDKACTTVLSSLKLVQP